jgi:NADH-quinone oxidoreductase subunit L
MLFIVFGGEPSPYVREHLHVPTRDEPHLWMAWTVGVLTLGAVVAGWIQMAGIWHPLSDFLHPVAEPKVEPSVALDWITSVIAVGLGLAGIGVAWALYSARRMSVPRAPAWQELLEHKFYFDELYDLLFYRPAAAIVRALYRGVEGPLVGGSIAATANSVRELGRTSTLVQSGYLRNYALALMAGLAVLAVLFVGFR